MVKTSQQMEKKKTKKTYSNDLKVLAVIWRN